MRREWAEIDCLTCSGINKITKHIKDNGFRFLAIREISYRGGKGKTRIDSVLFGFGGVCTNPWLL